METAIDYTGSSFIGLLISTFIRLSPELFKIWHKVLDDKHELAMLHESSKTSENTREDRSSPTPPVDKGIIDSIVSVWNTPSGNKRVDTTNQLVRPYTVYILLSTFVLVKIIYFWCNPHASLLTLWSKDDQMLLSGVLNFFFLNRVFDKR